MRDKTREDAHRPDPVSADAPGKQRALLRVQEHLLKEPSDVNALCRAGGLLQEMGRFQEAAAHLERAVSCLPDPVENDAVCLLSAVDSSPVETTFPGYEILMQLADCYTSLADYSRAKEICRAAHALAPTEARPLLVLGTLAIQNGQVDQAHSYFESANETAPDCGEAYSGLAMVYQQRQEHAAAFEMYLKCLELDTDNLVALLGLFQTSCQMGTFSKIIHYLEVYLAVHPDDTSVQFCLASLYAREGMDSEARQAVRKVLALEPDKPEAVQLLAELASRPSPADDRYWMRT